LRELHALAEFYLTRAAEIERRGGAVADSETLGSSYFAAKPGASSTQQSI
jgi:hypothetical protein